MRHALTLPTVFIVALAMAAQHAAAADPNATAQLASGWAEDAGERMAGLTIRLAPGWKTYWRAPGEAGIPPVFDWSASDNLAAVQVHWPSPTVFESFGMTTLGYSGAVTLPLLLTAADPARPIALRLALDYGVCADICVPEQATLALDIPADAPASGAPAIAAALAAQPVDAAAAGVARVDCALRGAGTDRAFEATLALADPMREPPVAVVEGPQGVWFAPAGVALTVDGTALSITAAAVLDDPGAWVARDALRVTLIGAERTIELRGCGG